MAGKGGRDTRLTSEERVKYWGSKLWDNIDKKNKAKDKKNKGKKK